LKILRRFLFEGEIMRLMSFTLLTKPIALMTQVIIARYYGAGVELDAYTFALFPVQFLAITVTHVFSAVAIPQLTKMNKSMESGEYHAYQNAMVLFFYVPTVLLMTCFLFGGRAFVDLVGSNLPRETKDYAYDMLRFLALPAILLCLVGAKATLLNLHQRFRAPGLMPPLNAAVVLVCILLLNGRYGIWSLPIGLAVSQVIQVPILLYRALSTRILTFAKPAMSRDGISQRWSLSWMVLITQGLLMINTFMDKWFATGLETGSISSINYSMTLINFCQQLFSLSLIVVMFTKMSEFLANNDIPGINAYIDGNLKKVANLVVPVSLGLFIISPEVIRILFQRGAFDAADGIRTSDALGMYLLGVPALVINGVVTKIFQSLQKLRQKIFLALQYIVTNIIGNVILVKSLATMGLAISSSIAINLHLVLSLLVLNLFRSGLKIRAFMAIIGRAYVMGGIAWAGYALLGLEEFFDGLVDESRLVGVFMLALLKFGSVVGLYCIQLWVWFRFLKRDR